MENNTVEPTTEIEMLRQENRNLRRQIEGTPSTGSIAGDAEYLDCITDLVCATEELSHTRPAAWLALCNRIDTRTDTLIAAAQADGAGKRDGWVSVDDRLPGIDQLLLVFTPSPDPLHPEDYNIGFDCIDQNDDEHASWLNHNEHYEHYCCVAKGENCTGPSEKAPYTHWMALPTAPAIATTKATQ